MSARWKFFAAAAALGAALLGAAGTSEAQSPARGRPHGPAAPAASATAPAAEGVVNVNTATEQELRRLPGVGPARAQAIVALRQRVQRFHAADDLMRVRGIGRAGMRRLRPFVTLTGATTLASRPGRAPRNNAPGGGGATAQAVGH